MRLFARAFIASVAAGVATLALTPARAESDTPRSVTVSFADLNLKSDAGKARLERRIAVAASTVCGPVDRLSMTDRRANDDCRTRAIANAGRAMVEVVENARGSIRVAAN
jgi:UrcA family protein